MPPSPPPLPAACSQTYAVSHPGPLATDPADPKARFEARRDRSDGRIVAIREFRHARYIMGGIDIVRI
jgi:hypothetical protein